MDTDKKVRNVPSPNGCTAKLVVTAEEGKNANVVADILYAEIEQAAMDVSAQLDMAAGEDE